MIGQTAHALNAMIFLIVSAVVLVILGLVFFLINLWIIDYAASLLGMEPAAEYVVLSASLLSAASMIGSKHAKK